MNNIGEKFILIDAFSPDEFNEYNSERYNFGSMLIGGSEALFATCDQLKWEKNYVQFIRENANKLTKNGAEKFVLSYEIYYKGDQCNFEIMNSKLLSALSKYSIDLPVSVYKLNEIDFDKLK